jgi:iron-sulfur cluster assembly protein
MLFPFPIPDSRMIQITEPARQRMRDFLDSHPEAVGVRFGVKRTGCSGFGYVVELAGAPGEADRALDIDGVPRIVDAKSLPLVDGTVIDFRRQGLNAGFVFHNPNATGECGCGESFTVGEQGAGSGK